MSNLRIAILIYGAFLSLLRKLAKLTVSMQSIRYLSIF